MPISFLRKYSEEEYLRLDAQNPYRSEYVDGLMFLLHDYGHTEPFTQYTSKHGLICGNLIALLHGPAKAAGLRLYPGNIRVKLNSFRDLHGKPKSHYEKPDLVATAEQVKPTALHLTAPTLIAEVLSPRTRDKDRWTRLHSYLELPSLTHYNGTYLVFNIMGNRYRLITTVYWPHPALYLKHFLTHREYDAWTAEQRTDKAKKAAKRNRS